MKRALRINATTSGHRVRATLLYAGRSSSASRLLRRFTMSDSHTSSMNQQCALWTVRLRAALFIWTSPFDLQHVGRDSLQADATHTTSAILHYEQHARQAAVQIAGFCFTPTKPFRSISCGGMHFVAPTTSHQRSQMQTRAIFPSCCVGRVSTTQEGFRSEATYFQLKPL